MLEGTEGGLDKLLKELRLWHGSLRVEPEHFEAWSRGARFYPVLYMLTRMGDAKDLGLGIPLKASMLGRMNRLEVHHIFPKSQLYEHGYKQSDVNALANFCFLTKDTNLEILDQLPRDYFSEIESNHPGALASQWIPTDRKLWEIENYHEFLSARRSLLAAEANKRLAEILHGQTEWLDGTTPVAAVTTPTGGPTVETEAQADNLNDWIAGLGLAKGEKDFDVTAPETGQQLAVFDIAWPMGLQQGLSAPVALLLTTSDNLLDIANRAGFRCFTSVDSFKDYVAREILGNTRTAA